MVELQGVRDVRERLRTSGAMPLPPYIRRAPTASDDRRYQTVFARKDGSVAAPTAGLHFSRSALERLREAGIGWASITLQVGMGTFVPLRGTRVEEHRMHPEYMEVDKACCGAWTEARQGGGRVIAVGTTTVRALESAVGEDGILRPFRGFTHLFIRMGHGFRAVDGMITNFHLPRTTLLMLVMAFAGKDRIREAYGQAIESGYRFYSYGDAMLIC
jgi:S-adenosylmethionine:tRNA ribosyltransferase-isomerase